MSPTASSPSSTLCAVGAVLLGGTACSALLVGGLLLAKRAGPLDQPNDRSLHRVPRPRSGGLGVLAALMPTLFVAGPLGHALVLPLGLLALVSWLDDRGALHGPVSVPLRLCVQLAAAGLLMASMGSSTSSAWGATTLTLGGLALVWASNLYNFMDGADGLAGSTAVLAFGTLGLGALRAGHEDLGLLSAAVTGGALGFLAFNLPPAKIFLGDVGSVPLGFLAGALGLLGLARGAWPWPFPLLVFAPFVVDATFTLLRRSLRGEVPWRAHREHLYQRLILGGWSHGRTSLLYGGLTALGSALALAMQERALLR